MRGITPGLNPFISFGTGLERFGVNIQVRWVVRSQMQESSVQIGCLETSESRHDYSLIAKVLCCCCESLSVVVYMSVRGKREWLIVLIVRQCSLQHVGGGP